MLPLLRPKLHSDWSVPWRTSRVGSRHHWHTGDLNGISPTSRWCPDFICLLGCAVLAHVIIFRLYAKVPFPPDRTQKHIFSWKQIIVSENLYARSVIDFKKNSLLHFKHCTAVAFNYSEQVNQTHHVWTEGRLSTLVYSKTCLERPLKKKTKIYFQDWVSLNAGLTYCRMLQQSILQYIWPALS